ncbi:hypothetical protein CK220_10730 [Mesorhizobium sp. WSM3860]|nr:hypothetical protein CK220_10730 [Mesorhizobium sp. WSM3860]
MVVERQRLLEFRVEPAGGDALDGLCEPANGSTSFIFAVWRSEAIVAHVFPPPLLPRTMHSFCECLRPDGPLDGIGVDV